MLPKFDVDPEVKMNFLKVIYKLETPQIYYILKMQFKYNLSPQIHKFTKKLYRNIITFQIRGHTGDPYSSYYFWNSTAGFSIQWNTSLWCPNPVLKVSHNYIISINTQLFIIGAATNSEQTGF